MLELRVSVLITILAVTLVRRLLGIGRVDLHPRIGQIGLGEGWGQAGESC